MEATLNAIMTQQVQPLVGSFGCLYGIRELTLAKIWSQGMRARHLEGSPPISKCVQNCWLCPAVAVRQKYNKVYEVKTCQVFYARFCSCNNCYAFIDSGHSTTSMQTLATIIILNNISTSKITKERTVWRNSNYLDLILMLIHFIQHFEREN